MVSMGGKIKKLRTERHMTQTEFAERLGVTKSAISSYENGSRLPSYDILLKMARIFKISTDMLLGNTDEHRITLDVTGLNRKQILLLEELTEDLKKGNVLQEICTTKEKRENN
ncbi:helix-turn-helix domain-containing protein [Evtepia sp.]